MTGGLDGILRGSIKKKILLLVFLCVLPSLAVIVNSGLERRENALKRAEGETFAVAAKASEKVLDLVATVRTLLETIAAVPPAQFADSRFMSAYLGVILDHNPALSELAVTDRSGGALAFGVNVPSAESNSRPFYEDLLQASGFTAGTRTVSRATFKAALPLALPVPGGGVAAALLNLDSMGATLSRLDFPKGTRVTVTGTDGTTLYDSQGQQRPGAQAQPAPAFAEMDPEGPDQTLAVGPDGDIMASFRLRLGPKTPPYAVVTAAMPASLATRGAGAALARDILLVLAATFLAMFTALVAGRVLIVGKLRRLIDAAGSVASGETAARSGLDYSDGEFGQLARSFDSMAVALTSDIENLRLVEQELKTSRDFLDKIINCVADPLFVKDGAHRYVLVNEAMTVLSGKTAQEMIGKDDLAFFPREQVEYFWSKDDLVMETGEEDTSEEVISDAAGAVRVIVTKKTRYIDPAGNSHVVGIIQDVTEAKRSGMELIRRTAELDTRVKMLDCLYGIAHLAQIRGVTLERILTEAAGLLAPMLTYSGCAVARIVYDGVRYPAHLDKAPAAAITADLLVRERCMGYVEAGYTELRPVQEEGPFTREEGKILRVVAEHLGQIAERVLAEQELKESEERFRRIVETANEGIAVLDSVHRITYVNTVMAEMLGYQPDELVGNRMDSFYHEGMSPGSDPQSKRQIMGRKSERLFRRKDGNVLCAIASVTPFTDREGRFSGSFGMYADITDRKMAEEKLQELNESLEMLVKERTEDLSLKTADLEEKARQLEKANKDLTITADKLERARERAVEATKAKSVFLANMSHEVRTPINAILGLSDLALRRGDCGDARRHLEMIHKSSKGLLALVNDILNYSKLEAGKAEVEAIDFDLPRLVRDTAGTFAIQAEEQGLDLREVIDDDVPRFVVSDPTKIRAILSNLLGNALKFTEEGSIRLTVTHARSITRFVVEDTGIGVPPDKAAFIFKSFRQADESVGRKYGGSGLGLSISRKLAKILGGTLVYEPREGGGSRFILSLPLGVGEDKEESRLVREGALRGAEQLAPMSILVAEDHEMGRELLVSFLTDFGHRVTAVEDGVKALEALRARPFDLVLMDGRMPVMDGLEAARSIRDGACGPDRAEVPIVAITAQAMSGDRETFLQAGMNDYVTKPVDLDEVLLVIAKFAPGSGPARVDATRRQHREEPPMRSNAIDPDSGVGEEKWSRVPGLAPRPAHGGQRGLEGLEGQATANGRAGDAGPSGRVEVRPQPASSSPSHAPAIETVQPDLGLVPLLDREAALGRLRGMTDLLEAMDESFLKTLPEDMEAFAQAVADGNAADARLFSHRIKGGAAGVGAARLTESARALEHAAAKGIVPASEELESFRDICRLTADSLGGLSASVNPDQDGDAQDQ